MTSDNAPTPTQALQSALAEHRGQSRRLRWIGITATALIVAAAAWFFFQSQGSQPTGQYVTQGAATGNLVVTVSATGTLQPTTSVDVGSEQSGTVATVLVQENDRVTKGQLLAQLDTAKLRDAVTRSQAALVAAEAVVAQTTATVAESKAQLARLRRVAELSGGTIPSQQDLDTADAAAKRAVANEASARAAVTQARAVLTSDETNLGKATIRSPVDGVVLTRKVEPGQSVAATMTVPVLFTLAQDLTRMELQVKVDEADVGSVQLGQPATFTVAAWPGRQFPATLKRVGLGSTLTDNVVTYKTILEVKNDDLALRPGMTATASIVTANRENVLLVPNAALRFSPESRAAAAKGQQASFVSKLMPRPPAPPPRRDGASAARAGSPQVWVLEEDNPRAVTITTGVTNGRLTEVTGGDLKPGMAVITDYVESRK